MPALLKEEFLRALMAGTLAGDLTRWPARARRPSSAMFQNLGRLLTEYYFPEEAQQIRQLVATAPARRRATPRPSACWAWARGPGHRRGQGLGPARHLQRAMRVPAGECRALRGPAGGRRAHALAGPRRQRDHRRDAGHDGEQQAARVAAAAERYARRWACAARDAAGGAGARTRLAQMAGDGHPRRAGSRAAAAACRRPMPRATGGAGAAADAPDRRLAPQAAGRGCCRGRPLIQLLPAWHPGLRSAVATKLQAQRGAALVLETLQRAGLRTRGVLPARPEDRHLTGRFGLGEGAEATRRFQGARTAGPATADLFAASCAAGADTLIADSHGGASARAAGLVPRAGEGADLPAAAADAMKGQRRSG
jgi:eukaryotic-like serine/threonine-protein kinase